METLRLALGWVALAIVALLGIALLIGIALGRLDLKFLIGDKDGDASMGRFQLLIFTFVVALSFIYLVTSPESNGFPDVPTSVLTLLGISGSSFLVSKGIDKAA